MTGVRGRWNTWAAHNGVDPADPTPKEVVEWLKSLRAEGLANTTILGYRSSLSALLSPNQYDGRPVTRSPEVAAFIKEMSAPTSSANDQTDPLREDADSYRYRPEAITQAVRVLNEALQADPEAVSRLFAPEVGVNDELANHPTIKFRAMRARKTTTGPLVDHWMMGLLGLINGLFGVVEGGCGYSESGHIGMETDKNGEVLAFKEVLAR